MRKFLSIFAVASLAAVLAACQTERSRPIIPPPYVPLPHTPVHVPVPPQQVITAGPLTQAGAGKYMDAQEAELRARLRGRGVGVLRRGNDILLTFPDGKLFDGMNLSSPGRDLLAAVALTFARYDHTLIEVNGYTDTSGTAEQNLDVSQKRAALVAGALNGLGVSDGRTEAHGFGATNLKVTTGDHVSEPRNRRIEIRVVPRPG